MNDRTIKFAQELLAFWKRRGVNFEQQLMIDAVSEAMESLPAPGQRIIIPRRILETVRECLAFARDEIRENELVAEGFGLEGATRCMKALRWIDEYAREDSSLPPVTDAAVCELRDAAHVVANYDPRWTNEETCWQIPGKLLMRLRKAVAAMRVLPPEPREGHP